jgi:hypothetical protein
MGSGQQPNTARDTTSTSSGVGTAVVVVVVVFRG